jgi:hypothetical protein
LLQPEAIEGAALGLAAPVIQGQLAVGDPVQP